jgi:hypothetical protein
MSSHEIETLLQPPDLHLSCEKALLFLNSHVKLTGQSNADGLVALDTLHTQALSTRDDLKAQVRFSTYTPYPTEFPQKISRSSVVRITV